MLGSWQFEMSLQIALAAVPVAVYFLTLGLLNSQRRPQMLSGRMDFALLIAALSPLCVVPLLGWVGTNWLTVGLSAAVVTAWILLLAPRRHRSWVVYNITLDDMAGCMAQALRSAGLAHRRCGERFVLAAGPVIRLTPFPLLRNVSLHVSGCPRTHYVDLARFEAELARRIARFEVQPTPMAVSFVLIATAMIVAPLTLMVERVPEMVRILTDLVG